MFTNMPNTQEVVRAKEELLQMMEDKYTELRQQGKTENEAVGAVISEFGNLEELAPQLGIAPQVTASLDPENNIAMDSNQVNQYLKDVRAAVNSADRIQQPDRHPGKSSGSDWHWHITPHDWDCSLLIHR
jgi:hypothetical protein